jgi:hypothetical protein
LRKLEFIGIPSCPERFSAAATPGIFAAARV